MTTYKDVITVAYAHSRKYNDYQARAIVRRHFNDGSKPFKIASASCTEDAITAAIDGALYKLKESYNETAELVMVGKVSAFNLSNDIF